MEGMESQPCVFLGIKVKPGPIERYKLENFTLENTVDRLRNEAEKKTNIPSASLELIHHGKILKDNATLHDSGVKSGEMVHVVKKKMQPPPAPPTTYSDAELQMLNNSLRTLGCTPNAAGWTRAMQLLNDESAMAEIIEHAPSLSEDCMTLSILHEVELLAALGANLQTMRRGAEAHPDLPNALRQLMRLVRSRSNVATTETAPTSGFAYSLEALSEDEDVEEEDTEEIEGRTAITPRQLAAALQVATEAVLSSSRGADATEQGRLLRLLQAAVEPDAPASAPRTPTGTGTTAGASGGGAITAEMFSSAISQALTRTNPAGTPMEQSTAASSSQSPEARDEDFSTQLQHMHEMGLLDDALNVRALLICAGDVNAAINLVFSGAIGDD
ncbi:ubiquitin-like protein 7 isoform X2 [Maniola jurtina]|uniref:ubiquitin-like protein 7 isoform X2 n=1 Tax=Maniola jurtina TaxID=191418 RepID=UPI001E68F224|nr:ubiquitin-like protein 7 isoform X2 [Maniola jurtina]